jgi:hypothetical protein
MAAEARKGRRVKLIIDRDHLQVMPEAPIEMAFIEDTLGLRGAGQSLALRRIDGDHGAFWLAARRRPRPRLRSKRSSRHRP